MEDEVAIGLLVQLSTIGSGATGGQPPAMVSAGGGAGWAADVDLAVLHDRPDLGWDERVQAQLAPGWQKGYRSTGAVAAVCQLAVWLRSSE